MLEKEIAKLKEMIISLFNTVEEMLTLTIEGIKKSEPIFLDRVKDEIENKVNKKEVELDKACVRFFALFQSEAKNMRIAFIISKLASDLERMGDRCVKIAESALFLIKNNYLFKTKELEKMMDETKLMLANSINAFLNEDLEKAIEVCKMDNHIDQLNREIFEQTILSIQKEHKNAEFFLHFLRIANEFEKIADLTTNISEGTAFIACGEIIKHHRYKKYEK